MAKLEDLIDITENLMRKYGVPIRDTWCGYKVLNNLDDWYSNQGYNGPKLIKVVYKKDGLSDVKSKTYTIENFKHLAYDSYVIDVVERMRGKNSVIVHEIVHYLQENNSESERNYIQFNQKNYIDYVSQKCELEAHFIQLVYILECEQSSLAHLSDLERQAITVALEKVKKDLNGHLALILRARELKILP